MNPTLAGFLVFIRSVMGINTTVLPDNSAAITYAYNVALMTVNPQLGLGLCPTPPGLWNIYAIAVYNLAGDLLINYAPDQEGQTYFATLRGPPPAGYGIYNFVAGVIESAHDETTGDSVAVPDSLKALTLSDLQRLKTPWGRRYLEIAQDFGPNLWGLS